MDKFVSAFKYNLKVSFTRLLSTTHNILNDVFMGLVKGTEIPPTRLPKCLGTRLLKIKCFIFLYALILYIYIILYTYNNFYFKIKWTKITAIYLT